MARRKAEIQLQMQVESQEEWEDLLSKEGLNVVDVYQEWCGPCTGMVANLRRLKNELGDDLLRFATAKADTIDALEKYRGHCEPCFLFYAGGCLVAVVRGANSPKILRVITEQLKQEHKVLDGNGERKEIKDPFISQMESQENEPEKEEEEEEEENVMEVTVALIKPDAVQAGKVDEILKDIKAHGIKILRHEERHMTEDEVRQFYSHLQDQDFFDELVKFMTSGPSHILALTKGKTGENIIKEFRDLIGPTDVEEAKTQKPESLRAKHGQQAFMNALHGSSSSEMATRELAFFFPDFVAPAIEGKQQKLQRTLALVRPDAFKMHKDQILAKIRESGFKVAMQKEMQLTKEMAEEFYKEHKGQPYFEQLVTNMSSGPVLALGLAREDAIEGWRKMLGPKEVPKAKEVAPESLRAQFAVNDVINPLHGSKSEAAAEKELQFFFPVEQTVAVIKPDAEGTKDEIIERIHEAGFRIAARKETTLSREVAEKFYADQKGKEYYNDLIEHMTSGPTYLMVLSREAAVEGWRSLIGPTDPAQAKQVNPNSIRATYGASILKNAVHGSSNPQHAQQTIKALFGDLKFSKDGDILETIKEEADGDAEQKEKPEAEKSEDAKEVSPEYRERAKEVKKEEEQQEPSDKQSPEDVVNDEQPTEETTDDNLPTAPESDEKGNIETKEATPKAEEKKEEKAPSPKPSETEAKPAEAEAKPSETEAKPEEQQEGSTVEKKSEEQTEQKTDSTAQGEDVKKEEVKAEEKTPEAPSTEESKAETKEETKADGAD